MAKKKETNENIGLVRQFDDMKKKHPDADAPVQDGRLL